MIFVTGCARSGTSLTAKILKAHGCNLGPVNVLYENTDIRQQVLKPYLKECGADPLGQRLPMPKREHCKPYPDLRDRILGRIPGHEPRAYKDAKLCWAYWPFAEAFPEAKWVIVRRDKERIVDSCMNTSFMWSHKKREPWNEWVEAHEQRFSEMHKELDAIEVWPDEVVRNPHAFQLVTSFCDLPFDLHATEQCIDKGKWHNAA